MQGSHWSCGFQVFMIHGKGILTNKKWTVRDFEKTHFHHLTRVKYGFIQRNKEDNKKNIYNMNCVELYRYSCLLQSGDKNNVSIYKKINNRIEMIYKFVNPPKLILLIKLYIENRNLNVYKNTFNSLVERAITQLTEFNLDNIVKLYSLISNTENNETVVYLLKFYNNHLINYYSFIDVKSFAIILNCHAKLRVKDMKLINKFMHIIIQNKLSFDITNYSIFFNSFYKLRIISNEHVNALVHRFINEISMWEKSEQKNITNKDIDNERNFQNGDTTPIVRTTFENYAPHHICNILLYFTIYDFDNIIRLKVTQKCENDFSNHDINTHITFLTNLLIMKKHLITYREILTLCQFFKSLKIKNDLLINLIEKKILSHFNSTMEQIGHKIKRQTNGKKLHTPNNSTHLMDDKALVKILFDMCTFYNDVNIYKESIPYFLCRKIDFHSAILLLYVYSEINMLHKCMITLLLQIVRQNYKSKFDMENVFLLIRSFYKICLNSQHYFAHVTNTTTVSHATGKDLIQGKKREEEINKKCALAHNMNDETAHTEGECNNRANDNGKQDILVAHSPNNTYPLANNSHRRNDLFSQIDDLSESIFSKLEGEFLGGKIHLTQFNTTLMCKILYYATILRKFSYLSKVLNLFINKKKDIDGFKNMLNVLYAYCNTRSNIYHCNMEEMHLINGEIDQVKGNRKDHEVVEHYNFLVNTKEYDRDVKNGIYFLFLQCKLNVYSFVNEDTVNSWLRSSFLNIHLLSILLNSLIAREYNIVTNFSMNNAGEIFEENENGEDKLVPIKKDQISIKKNVSNICCINLYRQIFAQINKLVLTCQNVYDIVRIFNAAFIFLTRFEKLKFGKTLNDQEVQMQKCVHSILKKIEKNIIQKYDMYNKEFIILFSAICMYSNNYQYLPFAFFFEYIHLFAFKNALSYMLLLSNDEEIKDISNKLFALTQYHNAGDVNQTEREDLHRFYTEHVSRVIRWAGEAITVKEDSVHGKSSVHGDRDNTRMTPFRKKNLVNIYKLLMNNGEVELSDFFKKIKDMYVYSIEINSALIGSLSLNELNDLCIYILRKKNQNMFLFKGVLKNNYEYINSEKSISFEWDYITNIVTITTSLTKYNFFTNNNILLNVIKKNMHKFDTLHKMNTLMGCLLQVKNRHLFEPTVEQLCHIARNVYINYVTSTNIVNLNEVIYFLYLLHSFENNSNFFSMFEYCYENLVKIKKVIVYPGKKYHFGTTLNNSFSIAKSLYNLCINEGMNIHTSELHYEGGGHVIHLTAKGGCIGTTAQCGGENRKDVGDVFTQGSAYRADGTCDGVAGSVEGSLAGSLAGGVAGGVALVADEVHLNDHALVTLFLLMDRFSGEQEKAVYGKLYGFLFCLLRDYAYVLNKEVVTQCLYIYFYSRMNQELLSEQGHLKNNNFTEENVEYLLNVLISFIHNLDINSILKLTFIYMNLFYYAQKKCNINEKLKILFDHIDKKKHIIENNNMLYEQVKRYTCSTY
ncbi:hypothetical protein, conserved [Plasmodium ovale wallikeri]|uniref:Uncharacterized protein n=1 Tax=Plasmodium ovale wallikeri TaxID=864142 RepID=A0A1A8YXT6_PLAOA|nr:hypothetical protein, conserved [Plasmodium ovale wallikeri]SBT36342.1 hypothetical protein, conserved [Plasmodium ovale wallikeri]